MMSQNDFMMILSQHVGSAMGQSLQGMDVSGLACGGGALGGGALGGLPMSANVASGGGGGGLGRLGQGGMIAGAQQPRVSAGLPSSGLAQNQQAGVPVVRLSSSRLPLSSQHVVQTQQCQSACGIPQLNQQTRESAGCPQPANISQSLNPSPTTLVRDPLATQINSLQLPSNFTAANNTVNAASLALPVVSTTAPPALNVNVNTGNMGNGTMGSMVHPANLAAMLQTNMAAHLPPQFAAALPMMPPHILQALAQAAATMPQPPTLPAPPAAPAPAPPAARSAEQQQQRKRRAEQPAGDHLTYHRDQRPLISNNDSGSSGDTSEYEHNAVGTARVESGTNTNVPQLPEEKVDFSKLPKQYFDQGSRERKMMPAEEVVKKYRSYVPGSTKKGRYRCDLPHCVPWSPDAVGFCNVPWRTMRRSHFNGKCQERGRIAGYTAPSGLSRTERQSTLRRVKEQRESLQQTEGKTRMTMAPVRLTKAKMHALPPPPPPPLQKPKPVAPAKVPHPSPRMPAASGGFVQIPSGLEPAPAPAPAPAPSDSLEDPLMQLLKPIAAALVQRTLETVLMNVLTGQPQ